MTSQSSRYHLADSQVAAEVLAELIDHYRLLEEPATERRTLYLDSFDWRLYTRGRIFKMEDQGVERRLILSGLNEVSAESLRLGSDMPKFSMDLPRGRIQEQVASLLEMRALLPQVEIKSSIRTLRLLDGEEKTVLRLVFEQSGSRPPGKGTLKPLAGRLHLLPVRGYIKPQQRLERYITGKLGLKQVVDGRLEEALAAIGREPADYSSKLNFKFDPQMKAGEAVKQIHLHLLNIMESNLPGIRADIDSEFLHDLRVAVRRTRSALTQIKKVFPEETVERFKDRLAWIGQITGPARDMDVYLLGFDGYAQSLPAQFRPDLDPLHAFLHSHQVIAHQEMVKKLNSPHMRKLLKDWRAFLEDSQSAQAGPARNAGLPVKTLASKRILNLYQRVLKAGLAINPESPPEAMHDLRKDCKKLRYMVEFFKSLFPSKEVAILLKGLKGLLNNLGDFQDLVVQAYKLREFSHQMVDEGKVPADTLLAMGMLVDILLKRQQQAQEAFAGRFAAFAAKENRDRFKALFSRMA